MFELLCRNHSSLPQVNPELLGKISRCRAILFFQRVPVRRTSSVPSLSLSLCPKDSFFGFPRSLISPPSHSEPTGIEVPSLKRLMVPGFPFHFHPRLHRLDANDDRQAPQLLSKSCFQNDDI